LSEQKKTSGVAAGNFGEARARDDGQVKGGAGRRSGATVRIGMAQQDGGRG